MVEFVFEALHTNLLLYVIILYLMSSFNYVLCTLGYITL